VTVVRGGSGRAGFVGGRPAGVLVTAAGPQMRDVLHELALPTFRRYAARWGYAVRAVDLPADGVGADIAAQRAKWEKIRLVRQALTEFPLVVWLDADVLLMRDDDDIAGHLHPGHFQALALEHVPAEHRVNPNTGVWLMRSHPATFDFLDAVEAAGPQPGPWADQGAVLAALGWDRGNEQYWWAGPGPGSRALAGTSWLPPGWNQPYVTGRIDSELYNGNASSYADRPVVAHPHALHFMGMTPGARHRHMSAVVRSISVPA
jgi:galactosyl transferase GMA12/MNN10 family